MAKGVVFIAGGVATKNPWLFDQTFLNAFDDGGRFTVMPKEFPILLLKSGAMGLAGARNVVLNTSTPDKPISGPHKAQLANHRGRRKKKSCAGELIDACFFRCDAIRF